MCTPSKGLCSLHVPEGAFYEARINLPAISCTSPLSLDEVFRENLWWPTGEFDIFVSPAGSFILGFQTDEIDWRGSESVDSVSVALMLIGEAHFSPEFLLNVVEVEEEGGSFIRDS